MLAVYYVYIIFCIIVLDLKTRKLRRELEVIIYVEILI
jgi:hypothetical protein